MPTRDRPQLADRPPVEPRMRCARDLDRHEPGACGKGLVETYRAGRAGQRHLPAAILQAGGEARHVGRHAADLGLEHLENVWHRAVVPGRVAGRHREAER